MHSKAEGSQPTGDQYRHGTAVLVILSVTTFITPINVSAVNVALPAIGSEYAADAISLSWVATAFVLATAVFLVPFGRLADIYGMKRIVLAGLVAYVLVAVMAALSGSMALLIAARALQGMASAMIFSCITALLVLTNPPERRGRVLGINVACVYAGQSIGPFVGGLLTQTFGWRGIFWLLALLGLVCLVLISLLIKGEWATAREEKFDWPGSVIYGVGLVALIWGFSELPEWPGFATIAASACILVGFVFWERKTKSPVLNLGLFLANRVFAMSNLAALINYSATWATTFLLSLYLQYIKGLSPIDAGLLILVMPVMQAVFSPISGRLSDKLETRWLVSGGMALTMAGLILFAFLDSGTQLPYVAFSLATVGLGFAFFSSPNTNAIMSSVEKKSLAIASATLATSRMIGQMLSMGTAMLILAVVMGHVQITPEMHPQLVTSVRVTFMVFAVLCFGGIFVSLSRGSTRISL